MLRAKLAQGEGFSLVHSRGDRNQRGIPHVEFSNMRPPSRGVHRSRQRRNCTCAIADGRHLNRGMDRKRGFIPDTFEGPLRGACIQADSAGRRDWRIS